MHDVCRQTRTRYTYQLAFGKLVFPSQTSSAITYSLVTFIFHVLGLQSRVSVYLQQITVINVVLLTSHSSSDTQDTLLLCWASFRRVLQPQ